MKVPLAIESDWNRYLALIESGLKKQANKVLLQVVKTIEEQGPANFKAFLYDLCEEGLGYNYASKIQYPIFVRCILPLLVDGLNAGSATEIIYLVQARAAGFSAVIFDAIGLIDDRDLLKRALVSEPENITAKNLLVHDYIEELYFGAHHLPEVLITDLETANSVIRESAEFILKNRDVINDRLVEEHQYYSQLYKDYEEWLSGNHDYDFAQWCEKNKRKYGWVQAYYYE